MATSRTIQRVIIVVLMLFILWQLSPLRDPHTKWLTFAIGVTFLCLLLGLRLFYARRVAGKVFQRLPATISFIQEPSASWKKMGEGDRAFEELEAMRFVPIGIFRIPELGILASGFVREEDQLAALVFELPGVTRWVEVFLEYQNGDSLSVSNAQLSSGLDSMPGERSVNQKGLSVRQVVERIRLERGAGLARTIRASDLTRLYREAYRRKQEWRRSRGGITTEEALRMTRLR